MNIRISILAALALSLCPLYGSAEEPDNLEVVRDTINYTTRKQLDTSDPMSHVVNNPATPPKGSGGLSHIKPASQTSDTAKVDSVETAKEPQVKQQPKYLTHVVKSGETLGKIASKYHVSVSQIVKLNGLRSADRISIGQKLKIRQNVN